mmetsp:Transcript_39352/g.80610  ORF Transcript_39352/g.80610 Transcript_39352/m.80610 type:complete len:162 (+) Transcript_39352:1031-1516(+)
MEILRGHFIVKEIDMIPSDPSKPWVKTKNKIFSKVSRIYAIAETKEIEFTLDVNTEIYKIFSGDKLDLLILEHEFKQVENGYNQQFQPNWLDFFRKDKIDEYEYVMYGTVFHSGIEKNKSFFYASFGGLLLKVFGVLKNNSINFLKTDSNILLLIRKKTIE